MVKVVADADRTVRELEVREVQRVARLILRRACDAELMEEYEEYLRRTADREIAFFTRN